MTGAREPGPGRAVPEADGSRTVSPDEPALVRRARGGDRDAFAILVDTHAARLHAMLTHFCAGDRELAGEFVQEAFVRAFERLDRFDGASAFYTWLYRLARNRAIDLLSRKRPAAMADEHIALVSAPDQHAGSRLDAADRARLVRWAMDQCSPEHREVLLLREWDGNDYDRIAELIGVAIGTVKSRLNRARAELRTHLLTRCAAEDLL
jgi:RNA polymerase sigma-70 factor, ECF subfamily